MEQVIREAEDALVWRASAGDNIEETDRLAALLGLSGEELTSRATEFGAKTDPQRRFDHALLPFSGGGSRQMRVQFVGRMLLGKMHVPPDEYRRAVKTCGVLSVRPRPSIDTPSAPPPPTPTTDSKPPKRVAQAERIRRREEFLASLMSEAGAPEVETDTLWLMAEPDHEWIERRRPELPEWGWVYPFFAPCTHKDGGLQCGKPMKVRLSKLVRWLDEVTRWNLNHPEREPRQVRNMERCSECWDSLQKSRELDTVKRALEMELATQTLVKAASQEKAQDERLAFEEHGSAVRRAEMKKNLSAREERLRELEQYLGLDPAKAAQLLGALT